MSNQPPKTRLVHLNISDVEKYAYDHDKKGKKYEINAELCINGQAAAVKDLPIPDDIAQRIIDLVEEAALKQIQDALSVAREHFVARIEAAKPIEHQNLLSHRDDADTQESADENERAKESTLTEDDNIPY